MSNSLRYTFVLFALLTFLAGAPLVIAPGRFLALLAWTPVDPILSRILGAALLALSSTAILGAQSRDTRQAHAFVQILGVFCVLATLGILRHLLSAASYPLVVWIVAGVLGLSALVWIVHALRR